MPLNLTKILNFVNLLFSFRHVERVVRAHGENRWENDAEHSLQLAMLAWYIIDSHQLDLDRNLVLKYALVHDLVEVHAGDTFFYTTDEQKISSKAKREADAAARLKLDYPEFSDLHQSIDGYEKMKDKESRFVYALDKVEPILSIYADGGRTWKEKEITIQMLIDYKKDKVVVSPEIEVCFYELITLLKDNEQRLFKQLT